MFFCSVIRILPIYCFYMLILKDIRGMVIIFLVRSIFVTKVKVIKNIILVF